MSKPTVIEIVHGYAGINRHPSGHRIICACNKTFPIAEFEFHLWVEATL